MSDENSQNKKSFSLTNIIIILVALPASIYALIQIYNYLFPQKTIYPLYMTEGETHICEIGGVVEGKHQDGSPDSFPFNERIVVNIRPSHAIVDSLRYYRVQINNELLNNGGVVGLREGTIALSCYSAD